MPLILCTQHLETVRDLWYLLPALLVRQVTLLQLAGQLPAQPQTRPGPLGTDVVVYQMQPEVQSSWKALKALCWCDDDLARRIARQWLQRLLAVTLQQYLKVSWGGTGSA